MTFHGEPISLADFVDSRLDLYTRSATYRAALHRESPDYDGRPPGVAVCPTWHRHAETTHCYQSHGCRCEPCRRAMSKHQKKVRTRRAQVAWERQKNEETRETA